MAYRSAFVRESSDQNQVYCRFGRVLLLCLLLSVLTTTEASAQYRVEHYTTGNGLPQNTISAITQTRDGYLWFATYDGLVRYDGMRFTNLDKGNSPGISSNQFLSLFEDDQGRLWAGTADSGLVGYYKGVFTSLTPAQGLPNKYVGRMQRSEDGLPILFFDTGEYNYLRWTGDQRLTSANIFLWTAEQSFVPIDERPVNEFIDRSQARWVIEPGKLMRFKGGQQTSFPVQLTLDEFFRFRYEDRAGNIWFASRDNQVYLIAGDTLKHYTQVDGLPSYSTIKFAGEDLEGNVWLYSQRRVMRYRDGHFTIYTAKDGINSKNIRAAFCDRDGAIWVGTNENGLYRLTRQFLTAYSQSDGLLANIVYPIIEDHTGAIWIGGGGGMSRFADGRFTGYLLDPSRKPRYKIVAAAPPEKFPGSGAQSFCEDREGGLWIGIETGVLLMKNGQLTDRSELTQSVAPDAIFEDRAGNLWFGTTKGLFKAQAGKSTLYTTKEGLPNNGVTVIYEDHQGTIWVGTRGGLARSVGDRFAPLTAEDGLAGNRIRSLYEDRDGALWIGTFDSGLTRLKDGRFTVYTVQTGLFNNGVFQILEDRRDNFWISCNRGIYRTSRSQLNDYAEGKIAAIHSVAYGTQEGMLSVECNGERQPAGIKARDGKLWFPNQKGIVMIDPEAAPHDLPPPLAAIAAVMVDRKSANFKDGITLEPGQANLEIQFTAPCSVKSEYVRFKFQLAGLDEEWTEAGTQRSVFYPRLPPGHYTFQVIAANFDGVWNETGTTLQIYMKPYFYQTKWFYAACALGFLMLAATIYILRVRQLKAIGRRLTQLVAERTADLVERTEQLVVANEKLNQLATLDGLTNIANRRRFTNFLEQEWQRARRAQTPISLLLMDVDYFKLYNDTYGHQGGDDCLKQVAGVLRDSIRRASDLAARYGGEEFAVILSETETEGAMVVGESIRMQIEALQIPHRSSKVNSVVTISLGVATLIPSPEVTADELIAAADQALYHAKEQGRNRCVAQVEAQAVDHTAQGCPQVV
ncbi:MAG: diguanylate cyclase [Acidobacteriota bacterium]